VTAEDAGSRLDLFLAKRLPAISRAQLQRLIRGQHVLVEGRPAHKTGLDLRVDSVVQVTLPDLVRADPEPEDLPLTVIYDDPSFLVINKAPGVVVHPGAGRRSGTLVNALLYHVKDLSGIGGVGRPGIVHRLDRGTSGVMVVAKSDIAHRHLAKQFQTRDVEKEYVALVWGQPRPGLVLDQPIGRDPRHRKKMSARVARGRAALTRVIDVEPFRGVSYTRVAIATGRTHQIRVHLSESGHAVVGDALYGGIRPNMPSHLAMLKSVHRPLLHAARLSFDHPIDGRRLTFDAPLPPDLTTVLHALRQSSEGDSDGR
jgi:23S rRNA pseudouridine1911/1915/1917 synthase